MYKTHSNKTTYYKFKFQEFDYAIIVEKKATVDLRVSENDYEAPYHNIWQVTLSKSTNCLNSVVVWTKELVTYPLSTIDDQLSLNTIVENYLNDNNRLALTMLQNSEPI